LWLDAKQVKVRDHGRVVSKALVVAYAVHEAALREVIGVDIGEVESGAFWTEFLRSLKKRELDGVRLAISDQHEGLKTAIARVLACTWQRRAQGGQTQTPQYTPEQIRAILDEERRRRERKAPARGAPAACPTS
jgi:hypothetical protein